MDFNTLLQQLIAETTGHSLGLFAPELALSATIVLLLLVRLFGIDAKIPAFWFAMLGALAGFVIAGWQFYDLSISGDPAVPEIFTGLLVYDRFTAFFRLFLLLFAVLVIALTVLSGIPDREDGPDFYTLLLGAIVGMMLMAASNHLLMLFFAVEMASVPSYAMVGFLKGKKKSSEAALKFIVYGAGAAGIMLYGASLLAGLLGTAEFPELAARLNSLVTGEAGMSDPAVRTVILGAMMVLVGLAFKLSIFPFHFWCPDAFEGAAAEVAGFLSVASKAAAFALLVRFVMLFVPEGGSELSPLYLLLGIGIGVIAAVTATFGNLAAYVQTNIKRLLAYSTIAHAGYMLMAVSALIVLLNAPPSAGVPAELLELRASRAIEGLLYYLGVYLFMNLGAFAIVALIRNEIFSEEIDDYRGLAFEMPVLTVCMGICLFSLVGLPPLGGFWAKLMIFMSLYDAGSIHWAMWAILAIGGLNTVISLFYYVRVIKTMVIDPRPEGARLTEIAGAPVGYVLLISLPVLLLGIFVQTLSASARSVAAILFN